MLMYRLVDPARNAGATPALPVLLIVLVLVLLVIYVLFLFLAVFLFLLRPIFLFPGEERCTIVPVPGRLVVLSQA